MFDGFAPLEDIYNFLRSFYIYTLLIKIIADLTDDLFELPEFLDSDGIRQLHVGCTDILPLSI